LIVSFSFLHEYHNARSRCTRTCWRNPEFDKLIDEEQRTGDHKKRMAILHQAGRIVMEDVPFATLYTLVELYGVARKGRAHQTVRFLPRK